MPSLGKINCELLMLFNSELIINWFTSDESNFS